ncbi:hypothetical protein CAEBREN_20235 [Caenorhabditis brenneri]|uniref:Uncharacterized protein n=1 Tax=Caenorhabditis brenneri TaxID=135651 RepID=G0N687_CAEBE|nr:hypothetical protein CAEBREN_20235 [Caenorhabditis brenneri]
MGKRKKSPVFWQPPDYEAQSSYRMIVQEEALPRPVEHSHSKSKPNVGSSIVDSSSNILAQFCIEVKNDIKTQFRSIKATDQGGYVLHHFIFIEAELLKFQKHSAWGNTDIEDSETSNKDRIIQKSKRAIAFHKSNFLNTLSEIQKSIRKLKKIFDKAINKIQSTRFWLLFLALSVLSARISYNELKLSGQMENTAQEKLTKNQCWTTLSWILSVLEFLEIGMIEEVVGAWSSVEQLDHVMEDAKAHVFITQNNELSEEEIQIHIEYNHLSLMVQRNQEKFKNLMETLQNLRQRTIPPYLIEEKNTFLRESSDLCVGIKSLHRILVHVVPAMSRGQLLEVVGNLMGCVSETRETATEFVKTLGKNKNNNSQTKEQVSTWGCLTGKIYWYLTVMRMALPGLNFEHQQQEQLITSLTGLSTTYMPEWWEEFLENIGKEVQGDLNQYKEEIIRYGDNLTWFTEQIGLFLGYDDEKDKTLLPR